MTMLVKLKDNTPNQTIGADVNCTDELIHLSAHTIGNLKDDKGGNILIFPHSFNDYGDGVDKQYVFSVSSRLIDGKAKVDSISTGNIMGFIGINGVDISISSRFSDGTDNDFFLMYMLQKVMSINVMNLKYGIGNDNMFELLVFMFPIFLRRAMRQGIFRQYMRKYRNDANVRGVISIKEQLRKNVPFNYKIAYSVREFETDNCVMQLIRHTIEYIRNKKEYYHILTSDKDTDGWVRYIMSLTPSYCIRHKLKVIKDNIRRPMSHPYYTEYAALQKLCVKILRHEKVGHKQSDNKIYGILFDGAWLWEEYLATLLRPLGYLHPKNKTSEGKIFLCVDNHYSRYPDFYRGDNGGIVLDAKYKRDFDTRDDLNQLITYMYRLKSHYGVFILPGCDSDRKYSSKRLLGHGGFLEAFRMIIPKQSNVDSFKKYVETMEENEDKLLDELRKIESFGSS